MDGGRQRLAHQNLIVDGPVVLYLQLSRGAIRFRKLDVAVLDHAAGLERVAAPAPVVADHHVAACGLVLARQHLGRWGRHRCPRTASATSTGCAFATTSATGAGSRTGRTPTFSARTTPTATGAARASASGSWSWNRFAIFHGVPPEE